MRIGIDIRNIGKKRTGDEQVFFNLVKNLAKIDNENEYLLFTDTTDTKLLYSNVVKPLGIEGKSNFKICPLTPTLSRGERWKKLWNNKFIWNAWTLPNYLRKNPVDVYHTQYITPFFVPKNIKIITTIHDISFNFFPRFIKWTDLFFLKILIPLSLKRADKVIAVSHFTKDEIVKYYKIDPEKVEVVYNAIGDNFFPLTLALSQRERKNIVQKYNLPEKFMLYLGTMQPRKNLPFLIEGFARNKSKLENIKLVIAGKKGGYNFDKKIDDAIVKNNVKNDVIFPGFVDEEDKPLLFCLADIFIFPSLYEGFGLPVLEAMSQGVPVLAADIPSLREVGKEAAIYFDPRSIDNFSKILHNLICDPLVRKNLACAGLRRVEFFSWEKSAQDLLKMYKSLISN